MVVVSKQCVYVTITMSKSGSCSAMFAMTMMMTMKTSKR